MALRNFLFYANVSPWCLFRAGCFIMLHFGQWKRLDERWAINRSATTRGPETEVFTLNELSEVKSSSGDPEAGFTWQNGGVFFPLSESSNVGKEWNKPGRLASACWVGCIWWVLARGDLTHCEIGVRVNWLLTDKALYASWPGHLLCANEMKPQWLTTLNIFFTPPLPSLLSQDKFFWNQSTFPPA